MTRTTTTTASAAGAAGAASRGPDALIYLAPLTSVLIWAGNAIVTKMAAGAISPWSISFYRWALALLLLAPFVARAAWANRAVARKVWGKIFVSGALGMVAYQCLAYVAAETTTAVNIGIIQALVPMLSSILAGVLASERLTIARVIGGAISLCGIIYLTSRGNPVDLLHRGLNIGDALMLVAIVASAFYSVLLKRWNLPLPVWQQIFWQICAALLILFPLWLSGEKSAITAANLPLVLYAAIPASLLAPACWMISLGRLGAARSSVTINLLPPLVAVLAFFILDEQLQPYHYIGGCVAIIGVVVGLREWKFGAA